MPVESEPGIAIPWEETLDGLLGFEVLDMGTDSASARFEVAKKHCQLGGNVHGGTYSALAEGLVSYATVLTLRDQGKWAVGTSNFTSFFRPVSSGVVTANARAIHSGRTTWVWEVEFTTDDGKRCAASRVSLAVVEPSQPR
jgi:1,4-dihydroxy-2-naphthoyl-CoA hydrolase